MYIERMLKEVLIHFLSFSLISDHSAYWNDKRFGMVLLHTPHTETSSVLTKKQEEHSQPDCTPNPNFSWIRDSPAYIKAFFLRRSGSVSFPPSLQKPLGPQISQVICQPQPLLSLASGSEISASKPFYSKHQALIVWIPGFHSLSAI